jgi:hypothetical protein
MSYPGSSNEAISSPSHTTLAKKRKREVRFGLTPIREGSPSDLHIVLGLRWAVSGLATIVEVSQSSNRDLHIGCCHTLTNY